MAAATAGCELLAKAEEGRVAGLAEAEAGPGASGDGFLSDAASALRRMAEVEGGDGDLPGKGSTTTAGGGGASDAVRGVLERVPEFVDTLGRLEGVDLPGDEEVDGELADTDDDDEADAGADDDVDAWTRWIDERGPRPTSASEVGRPSEDEVVWPVAVSAEVRASDDALWGLMALEPVATARRGAASAGQFGAASGEEVDDLAEAMQAELDLTTMKESMDEVDMGNGLRARSAEATLVGSMARSVGAQAGQSGPATSLLGQLGVRQPEEWLAGMAD